MVILALCTVLAIAAGEKPDWLVDPSSYRAHLVRRSALHELELTNGLVRRVFRIAPAAATVGFDELVRGRSILRAVRPEAHIDTDRGSFDVGGLVGQPDQAYLRPEWIETLRASDSPFTLVAAEEGPLVARLAWKRVRHDEGRAWPPPGVALHLRFQGRGAAAGLDVGVHYQIYDGMPLIEKWITLHNASEKPLVLHSFASEILAAVESESIVDPFDRFEPPDLHVESDFAFGGGDANSSSRVVHWEKDPSFTTQVSYELLTPCLLVCKPPLGPELTLAPGEDFESFRVFELAQDSSERERRGLAERRMYRTIAPWVTENPLLMHVRSADQATVHNAVDQCAAVGFEMMILSFGSGFDVEDRSPTNLAHAKELAQYAHGHGIELGSYSLLSSRSIDAATDVVDEKTGKPGGTRFGSAPCIGSAWAKDYFAGLVQTYDETPFDVLEHDGSYPGDPCASTKHPGHTGLLDSQWKQWCTIRDFYRGCRARGIYLNVPDYYFLAGSNKCAMGYRETNWSLPRDEQIVHARQNIYDGTWTKTPSMGWMFVPLTEYQGGGAAATIEPLVEHLDTYAAHLANDLGLGVQACWRGPRLFDAPQTRALVEHWVSFFKQHRAILESDLIHLRRADGRDWDGMLHVNPATPERALAMLYNPLAHDIVRTITLPLYYAGLSGKARVLDPEGQWHEIGLDPRQQAELEIRLPARASTWRIFEPGF